MYFNCENEYTCIKICPSTYILTAKLSSEHNICLKVQQCSLSLGTSVCFIFIVTNERITNNENNITNKNHDSKWWCCDSHMDIIMLPYGKKGVNVYDRTIGWIIPVLLCWLWGYVL